MPTGMTQDPRVLKLVERQLRNWEIARSQRQIASQPDHARVADFVCISREVGVGGAEIARMLGQRLGWAVFDKEILHVMAGDDVIREQVYASMDERDLNWLEEMMRALLQSEFKKNDYFHVLTKTILSLARQGNGVFVGRGADLVLPRTSGLRVRIVAPFDGRVKRVMERYGLSEHEARAKLGNLERDRAEFIRLHFNADIHDAHRYDLVLNLAGRTPEQAVCMIEAARKYF